MLKEIQYVEKKYIYTKDKIHGENFPLYDFVFAQLNANVHECDGEEPFTLVQCTFNVFIVPMMTPKQV